MKLLTKFTAVFDRLVNFLFFLVGAGIIVMMLAVSADVVGRYFLKRPIVGVMELSQFLLLYIVFLGAVWLLREEAHVRVDLLLIRFKPRTQALLNTITSCVAAIICLPLIWWGILATVDYYQKHIVTIAQLEILLYPVIAVIPFGSLLLFIQCLRRINKYYTSWKTSSDRKAKA